MKRLGRRKTSSFGCFACNSKANILNSRQHIEDIIVMGFTELPDNRKINIVASIGEDIEKE